MGIISTHRERRGGHAVVSTIFELLSQLYFLSIFCFNRCAPIVNRTTPANRTFNFRRARISPFAQRRLVYNLQTRAQKYFSVAMKLIMFVFTFAAALGCAFAAGAGKRATLSEALRGRMVAHAAARVRTKSSHHADSSLMHTSTSMRKATSGEALMPELRRETCL